MIWWGFLALSVTTTVFGQLFYKNYSLNQKKSHLIFSIMFFCFAVPFSFLAVTRLGIGKVYIGSALSYVLTPIMAEPLLGEKVERTHWKYLALITMGVIVYSV